MKIHEGFIIFVKMHLARPGLKTVENTVKIRSSLCDFRKITKFL